MSHRARFDYLHSEYPLVLKSTYQDHTYYGVDIMEGKRIKLIMHKFRCGKNFHSLPGRITATLNPFIWDRLKQCFRLDTNQRIEVHLNTLEEALVNFPFFNEN